MERESRSRSRSSHVLVFPFPGQGHMIPLLDLAYSLASRGLSITVLTTTQNQFLLTSLLTTASLEGLRVQPLLLPLTPTEGLPQGRENMQQLPMHLIPLFMSSLKQLANPIEEWFLEKKNNPDDFGPPLCMISDFFLGWTQQTATNLGIPRIVFYPSGAFAVSVVSSLWKHMPHEAVASDDGEVHIPDLPHPLTFPRFQISPLARSYKKSDPVSEFMRYSMNLNLQSWASVINTFEDLEALYIHHLEKITARPVWSVGPLLPPVVFQEHKTANFQRGNPNAINESLCLQWLECREKRSVVYICFGSQAVISNKQMEEIAAGLEASEESFIWVVKDPPYPRKYAAAKDYGGVFPTGFEERTKEKGLVIRGWAPQLLILSHPSVGGFLTHCGWNSTLESITLGVPLITWPMSADQYCNALLVVEYLKVGVRLCEGPNAVPSRHDFKRAVKRVLRRQGEETKRAVELSMAARTAVQERGSSSKDLRVLATEIQKLSHTP